jgi:flavodoxin
MKIAIAYVSNTGSTYLVSEQVQKQLTRDHEVVLKKATEFTPLELSVFDCVILGTPSWLVGGVEGLPPEPMIDLLHKIQTEKHLPKLYAVFGTGERSYAKFCGGADYADAIMRALGVRRIGNILKLDSYFIKLDENNKLTEEWISAIRKELKNVVSK